MDSDYDDADAPPDDDQYAPDPATLSIDQVSKMLRALRALYGELAEYERLHAAELARLTAIHERHAGPLVRRIQRLEDILRSYGVRAYQDFRKTKIITPNGAIVASRPLLPEISVHDDQLALWEQVEPIVERKPKVPVAKLRSLLTALESTDRVRRAILRDEVLSILDLGVAFERELYHDEQGVYVERPDDPDDPWLLIEGLHWTPAGHGGSGRKFTVTLA